MPFNKRHRIVAALGGFEVPRPTLDHTGLAVIRLAWNGAIATAISEASRFTWALACHV
jgi:hypothetical protein